MTKQYTFTLTSPNGKTVERYVDEDLVKMAGNPVAFVLSEIENEVRKMIYPTRVRHSTRLRDRALSS